MSCLSGRETSTVRRPALSSTVTGAVGSANLLELCLVCRGVRHRVEQVERALVVVVAPEDPQPRPAGTRAELLRAIGVSGAALSAHGRLLKLLGLWGPAGAIGN